METNRQFCDKLSGETCLVIEERCFRTEEKKPCEYYKTYFKLLTQIEDDTPPIARKARENMFPLFRESWKRHAQKRQAGMKRVVASPLEKELRVTLKSELEPLGVSMPDTGKKIRIWEDTEIIADGLAEKKGFPTCIFSFKTWVGNEQIRETFAYAYLAKTWLGQKNIRVYEIGILQTETRAKTLATLIEICKPFLDGVFYLTSAPYLDDLIGKLKELYSEPGGGKP